MYHYYMIHGPCVCVQALVVKEQLERRGWMTWMDVDKMAGSTLEAMALAVEGSVAVLVGACSHMCIIALLVCS